MSKFKAKSKLSSLSNKSKGDLFDFIMEGDNRNINNFIGFIGGGIGGGRASIQYDVIYDLIKTQYFNITKAEVNNANKIIFDEIMNKYVHSEDEKKEEKIFNLGKDGDIIAPDEIQRSVIHAFYNLKKNDIVGYFPYVENFERFIRSSHFFDHVESGKLNLNYFFNLPSDEIVLTINETENERMESYEELQFKNDPYISNYYHGANDLYKDIISKYIKDREKINLSVSIMNELWLKNDFKSHHDEFIKVFLVSKDTGTILKLILYHLYHIYKDTDCLSRQLTIKFKGDSDDKSVKVFEYGDSYGFFWSFSENIPCSAYTKQARGLIKQVVDSLTADGMVNFQNLIYQIEFRFVI